MTSEATLEAELDQLLSRNAPEWPELLTLSDEARKGILHFYRILLKGNEVQNLTRLTSPSDFYYGHVVDVLELLKREWLEFPALDLGSGAGVPGLLAAVIRGESGKDRWVLVESEKRKAEFLRDAVQQLGLSGTVRVAAERIEDHLKSKENRVGTVVARAIGPIERIYAWLRNCSTWNGIILLKGPNWDKEWSEFQQSKYKGELEVVRKQLYHVGPEQKERCLVQLARVLRGTPRRSG